MQKNETMQAGYYDCFLGLAEHTFGYGEGEKVHQPGKAEVWFDCFGGHEGPERVYPAPFYIKRGYLGFRKETSDTRIGADLIMARLLTQMRDDPPSVDEEITEYGTDQFPCHANLTYLITGVCHQACNSILASGRVENSWSILDDYYLLCPPSGWVSYLLYGFWGCGIFPSAFEQRKDWFNYCGRNADLYREEGRLSASEDFMSKQREISRWELQQAIDEIYDRHERGKALAIILELEEGDVEPGAFEAFLDRDEALFARKQENDLNLLRGNLSKEEAAAALNEIAREYQKAVAEYCGDAILRKLQGDTEVGEVTIASVDQMPEIAAYVELGKQLKL